MIPVYLHGSCPNGCEPCSKRYHAIVKKYANQARLEDVTAHTVRHSFAKNLVDAGTPLDQVAILLGHENLDTTRIYTQPRGRDLERAVQWAAGENFESLTQTYTKLLPHKTCFEYSPEYNISNSSNLR